MLHALLAPIHSTEKQKILSAIELLGPKVTPELIALETGMPLLTTIRQLNLVAAETQAHLQVDSSGKIFYYFSPNFAGSYIFDLTKNLFYSQGRFAVKLCKVSIRLIVGLAFVAARITFGVLWFLFRVSFGVILIGSIVVIIFGLFALLSNGDGGGDAFGGLGDLGGSGADAGSTAGGALLDSSSSWGPGLGECLFDLCRCFEFTSYLNWWSHSSGYAYDDAARNRSYSIAAPDSRGMTLTGVATTKSSGASHLERSDFFMDLFSFIFGDGEPNLDLEDRQWKYVGRVIERNNGVVVAEQIAPYMRETARNEDWMLSVLVHFNGAADVSETGNIIYVFPSFIKERLSAQSSPDQIRNDSEQLRSLYHSHVRRQTMSAIHENVHMPPYLLERNMVFSLAGAHATLLSAFLVSLNLIGSIWFFGASSSMPILQGMHGPASFMLVFAIITSAIPALRAVALGFINSSIDKRNRLRMERGQIVSKADEALKVKLRESEQICDALASELHSDVVYMTDRDVLEQEFANREIHSNSLSRRN
jgi:hypothetical protein